MSMTPEKYYKIQAAIWETKIPAGWWCKRIKKKSPNLCTRYYGTRGISFGSIQLYLEWAMLGVVALDWEDIFGWFFSRFLPVLRLLVSRTTFQTTLGIPWWPQLQSDTRIRYRNTYAELVVPEITISSWIFP